MPNSAGRHRAAARFSPTKELAAIVADAGGPAAKGVAIAAASGGLIAAVAVPAVAAPEEPPAPTAEVAVEQSAASIAPAVTAPTVSASSSTNPTTAFGEIKVSAVAKPTGPTPAQLRARAARAAEERAAEQAAAEQAEREQAASRSQERADESSDASGEQESTGSGTSESTDSAPSSDSGNGGSAASSNVIEIAKQYIGTPYVYGGSTPSGFDCSGFTQYVFAKAGISLPRVTTAQQAAVTPVSSPQPGDLVFFGSPAWHVGIYVGDGQMIDSPRTGSSISIRPVFSGVSGYGRP